MEEKEETQKLRYGAASNISFHGIYDTEIPKSEWEQMTMVEQDRVYYDALDYLVELTEVD